MFSITYEPLQSVNSPLNSNHVFWCVWLVLDRETDQDKSLDPEGPRIRCPECGWSPRKHSLDLHPWQLVEYVRHRGSLPSVPPPQDFDASSVANGRRVCEVTRCVHLNARFQNCLVR
jgi:hypothetical protein